MADEHVDDGNDLAAIDGALAAARAETARPPRCHPATVPGAPVPPASPGSSSPRVAVLGKFGLRFVVRGVKKKKQSYPA